MRKQIAPWLSSMILAALLGPNAMAQTVPRASVGKPKTASVKLGAGATICEACIRAHEEFLASDAMQGRGSGTHDELVAATYVASELRQYGIDPAGDNGDYIQLVPTIKQTIVSPPELKIAPRVGNSSSEAIAWNYGKEFLVASLTQTQFSGPLRKLDGNKESDLQNAKIEAGAVVLITGSDESKVRDAAFLVASQGAAATLILASDKHRKHFEEAAEKLPHLPDRLQENSAQAPSDNINYNVLELNQNAFHLLTQMQEGAMVRFEAQPSDKEASTCNALGILRGSEPSLQHSAIVFAAHLDHLGIGKSFNGDNIYNGADDDASGVTAVLEIARVLGRSRRPRRTVIFAFFGSEETGGQGSTYFRQHPPLPLNEIAANLEFEMIGRPDPAVHADTLWLTGWERSNLGPALAAHGAPLVGDPHPEEDFFSRSDNFVLARKGVVAQTISSYGLHADYHQPSDDLVHLDFKHLEAAIRSLLAPVEWLVNSSFGPTWNAGGQP